MNVNEIKYLIEGMLNKFTNKKGVISSTYPPTNAIIACDLDDVVPYIKYFGYEAVVENQIDLILDNYGLWQFKNSRDIVLWRYDEWIGALLVCNSKRSIQAANSLLKDILIKCGNQDYLNFCYDIKRNKSPLAYFSPRSYGIFETIFENQKKIDPKLLLEYKNIFIKTLAMIHNCNALPMLNKTGMKIISKKMRVWALNGYYQSVGFKRFLKLAIVNFSDYRFVKVMKDNTNFLFSLLEFMKMNSNNRENYKVFYRSILLELSSDVPVTTFHIRNGEYTVCQSTAIIDNICDYLFFVEYDEELVLRVKKIADYYISIFDEKSYLTRNHTSDLVHVDECMDFSIALKRISEVCQEEKYLNYAKKIFETTKVHLDLSNHVVFTYYNIKTGERSRIDPKYCFLYLKGLIVFEVAIDESLFGDSPLYALAKDR